MTNPTTDEATGIKLEVIRDLAVLPRSRRLESQERDALIACADEIQSLRARLTAATQRAEQAERMLAEAVRALTDAHKTLCWAGPRMRAKLSESEARTVDNCAVRMRVALTSIRSAASGEQG